MSETVDDKKIDCILIFDEYSKSDFEKDFAEFLEYQKKIREGLIAADLDFKLFQLKQYSPISYSDFKKYSEKFFKQQIFYLIKNNKQLILSNELTVEIKIHRIPDRAYYFAYDNEESDDETACFEGAGIWFIQTLVAPGIYLQKIDASYLYRYWLHELQHHIDYRQKQSYFYAKLYERFNKEGIRRSARNLLFLYNSVFNLREEGLPDFNARRFSGKYEIIWRAIEDYNRNLETLTKHLRIKDAETYYESTIGYKNLTPTGENANGRAMCLFIALAIAKEQRIIYTIRQRGEQKTTFSVETSVLQKDFEVELPAKLVDETLRVVAPLNYKTFIAEYVRRCKQLGITSDSQLIITEKRFKKLRDAAINNAKDERKSRLRAKRFIAND